MQRLNRLARTAFHYFGSNQACKRKDRFNAVQRELKRLGGRLGRRAGILRGWAAARLHHHPLALHLL